MKDMKYIVKDNVIVNNTCLHCKKKNVEYHIAAEFQYSKGQYS